MTMREGGLLYWRLDVDAILVFYLYLFSFQFKLTEGLQVKLMHLFLFLLFFSSGLSKKVIIIVNILPV